MARFPSKSFCISARMLLLGWVLGYILRGPGATSVSLTAAAALPVSSQSAASESLSPSASAPRDDPQPSAGKTAEEINAALAAALQQKDYRRQTHDLYEIISKLT